MAKFHLNLTNVETLVNTYISHTYKGVTIECKQSQTSNSIYLYLTYKDEKACLRISDHYSSRGIKTLVIKKSTSIDNVKRFIANRINQMKRKHVRYLLDKINKD